MLRHGDSIDLPDEFDDDLCYLLGLIFGDGDIMLSRRGENRGHVRITNSDEAILERATEIVDDTFDKRPRSSIRTAKPRVSGSTARPSPDSSRTSGW